MVRDTIFRSASSAGTRRTYSILRKSRRIRSGAIEPPPRAKYSHGTSRAGQAELTFCVCAAARESGRRSGWSRCRQATSPMSTLPQELMDQVSRIPFFGKGASDLTRWAMAVKMTVSSTGRSDAVTVEVLGEGGEVIASHDATSNEPFEFVVDSPALWSPGSPHLYNLTITMGVCFSALVTTPSGPHKRPHVRTCFVSGLRADRLRRRTTKLAVTRASGPSKWPRSMEFSGRCLTGSSSSSSALSTKVGKDGVSHAPKDTLWLTLHRILAQGHPGADISHAEYRPDRIYTPPNREAMVYDLEVLKGLGANMVRKHVSGPRPAVVATLLGANAQ